SVQHLPINDDQIRHRHDAAENEYSALGQELARLQTQVDNLQAMVVAIQRYVADPHRQGGTVNVDSLRQELEQHTTAIANYRERITEPRRLIAAGRSQVGPGDPRYERDTELRAEVRTALQREMAILQSAGRTPADVVALLARLDTVEQRTEAFSEQVRTV